MGYIAFTTIVAAVLATILILGTVSALMNMQYAHAGSSSNTTAKQPCKIGVTIQQPSGTKNITILGEKNDNDTFNVTLIIQSPSTTQNITIGGTMEGGGTVDQLICS